MPWPAAAAEAALCLLRRLRRTRKTTPKIRAPTTARPPTTPPAMAPRLIFGVGAGVDEGAVVIGLTGPGVDTDLVLTLGWV